MKKYTILKNWHYSFFLLGRLFGWNYNKKNYSFDFKMSKECWYEKKVGASNGLNKIGGLSFGIFGIHRNSVRLTWIPNFEKKGFILLYGYVYDNLNKTHTSRYICEIEAEKKYTCSLDMVKDDYYFKFDMYPFGTIEMENNLEDSPIQKQNYPYFGGHERSPQKMDIWLSIKAV